MDHLKFVETPLNKGIEETNILTAQIYAQTNRVNNFSANSLNVLIKYTNYRIR